MATATIEITLPGLTGFTLTLDLYPLGSDTAAASGLTLTEATNRKGTYTTTTTAELTGAYLAMAKEGSTVRGEGYVAMTDTASVHVVGIDLPGKVLGGGSGTISGVGARVVDGDGEAIVGGATAAEVWAHATRTLTMTVAEIATVLTGTNLVIHRGDTTTIELTALGDISTRSGEKLYFTVKESKDDTDLAAVIQITELTGAIRLNGSSTTTSYASITVTNENTGAVTILLKYELTKQLATSTRKKYYWDIQVIKSDNTIKTLTEGTLLINPDVTHSTS